MATFNKFNQFVEDLVKGVHNFSSHTFKVMLTNTLPVAANSVRADITELAAGGGYTTGGHAATFVSSEQTGGTLRIIFSDPNVFTATSAGIGPFRYVVFYNDTPTSPADPLIGWWDYGEEVNLLENESFLVDFDVTLGIVTLS